MERERRNRNIRFYNDKEKDCRAWDILHSKEIESFSSQNDFIIQAINDYFDRHLAVNADPYLETREKEDNFADRIVDMAEKKILANLPALMGMYLLGQQGVLSAGLGVPTLAAESAREPMGKGNYATVSIDNAKGVDALFEGPVENEFLDLDFCG